MDPYREALKRVQQMNKSENYIKAAEKYLEILEDVDRRKEIADSSFSGVISKLSFVKYGRFSLYGWSVFFTREGDQDSIDITKRLVRYSETRNLNFFEWVFHKKKMWEKVRQEQEEAMF